MVKKETEEVPCISLLAPEAVYFTQPSPWHDSSGLAVGRKDYAGSV